MPFKKGQSGNPGGRPKRIPRYVAEVRKIEPALWARLISIAQEGEHKDALRALELLLAYSRGRPVQRAEVSGPDGGPIGVASDARAILADPEARAVLQRIALAAHGADGVVGGVVASDPGGAGGEAK